LFQLTHDKRLASAACPDKALTAVDAGSSLSATSPFHPPNQAYSEYLALNYEGKITSVAKPSLAIFATKEDDSSLDSAYFALLNVRTQLAMGVVGTLDSCTPANFTLETQVLSHGSPNQQFIYKDSDNTIASALCPTHVIEVSSNSCADLVHLQLAKRKTAVCSVKIQLKGLSILNLAEVEVFNSHGQNIS
jgi:hypothetical protein